MAKAVRSCLKLTALISIRTPHRVFPNPRHHPSHHPRDPSPLPSLFFGGEDSIFIFFSTSRTMTELGLILETYHQSQRQSKVNIFEKNIKI